MTRVLSAAEIVLRIEVVIAAGAAEGQAVGGAAAEVAVAADAEAQGAGDTAEVVVAAAVRATKLSSRI